MLHPKFQVNRPSDSGEADFFTIYEHDGHRGHVTWTKYIKFLSSFI